MPVFSTRALPSLIAASAIVTGCSLFPGAAKVTGSQGAPLPPGTTPWNTTQTTAGKPPRLSGPPIVVRPPSQTVSVSTLAGDGTNRVFTTPEGLAALGDGSLVVADHGALALWRVSSSGQVSLLAGGTFGRQDGTGSAAQFWSASDVALAPDGSLIVADGDTLRKVTQDGTVTTLTMNGPDGKPVPYVQIFGVAVEPGGAIDLSTLNRIDRRGTDGVVRTVAGTSQAGFADGKGEFAAFNLPGRLAWNPAGYLVVADSGNDRIRRVNLDGTVSTIAGIDAAGLVDGPASSAAFDAPSGIAVKSDGTILVSDSGNYVVRQIAAGQVTTVAGADADGFSDGLPALAEFGATAGIALTAGGGLAIADPDNQRIRILK